MNNTSFDVFIEINDDSGSVKYEFDKDLKMLRVDRFMPTSMHYPCNYGFIPNTLSGDGDPLDALVYTSHRINSGTIIEVRAIGVLMTHDEKGDDAKIIAVPTPKIDPFLENILTYEDLPKILLNRIQNFFENYKALEPNKWVKVLGWHGIEKAYEIINECMA